MAFDFKKEFKEFYMPKNKPEIVTGQKQITLQSEEREIRTKKAGRIKRQSVSLFAIRLKRNKTSLLKPML